MAGADMSRVFGCDKPFQINTPSGLALLNGMIERRQPALVVIDPIFSYTRGNTNDGPVARSVMDELNRLGEKYECSIDCVRHVNKSKGQGDPRASGMGSGEWRNAARSELLFGADPKNENNGVIARIKGNRAEKGSPSIGYQIQGFPCDLEELPPGSTVSGVIWTGRSSITPKNILATLPPEDEYDKAIQKSSTEFLQAILQDGEVASADIKLVAKAEDISPKQLEKARGKLGVKIRYAGQGKDQKTYWSLPDSNNRDSEVSPLPQVSPEDSRFPISMGKGETSKNIDIIPPLSITSEDSPLYGGGETSKFQVSPLSEGGDTSEYIENKDLNPDFAPGFPPILEMGNPEGVGKPENVSAPDSNNSNGSGVPTIPPIETQFPITDEMRKAAWQILEGTHDNRQEAQRLLASLYRSGRLRQSDLGLVEKVRDQLRDPKVISIPESRMNALRELELERGVGH